MKLTIFASLFFFLIFPLYAPHQKAPFKKLEHQRGNTKFLEKINRKKHEYNLNQARKAARDNKAYSEESDQWEECTNQLLDRWEREYQEEKKEHEQLIKKFATEHDAWTEKELKNRELV